MKTLIKILVLTVLMSCDSDSAWNCIQTAGDTVQISVEVTSFEKIFVNRDVELILSEGPELEIIIESGEHMIDDIEVKVNNGQLRITDNNSCNYVREYGITKVFVTTPNITEIRNSSQYEVSSAGILNYPDLKLISEDFNIAQEFTVGDFRLQLNSTSVQIVSNNISSFYISGQTENLNVGFFAGAGRFEGANLIAQNVVVFHRGSNDMIVNPQQSLTGELRGTGDLISVNEPPLVDVEQFYTGQLIFED
jgi:hypothetical protein